MVELRFRYGDAVVRRCERAVRLDDAAAAARRVPARRGARARGGGARRRARSTVEPGNIVALAAGERVAADVIVGADGANGITARAVGLGEGIVYGVAYEGNVPYPTLPRERYARRAVLELADIPGGYAWVFPKGDHANVGVGGWQERGAEAPRAPAPRVRGARPRPGRAREPARPPAAAAPAGDADRGRAGARRRRRGRPDRPGLGRRDVRVLRLVAARDRRDPRPARRPRDDARARTRRRSTPSSRRCTAPRGS